MDEDFLESIGIGGERKTPVGKSWESWFQETSQTVLNAAGQAKQYDQNFELQKLKLQQQNQYGQMYTEGRPIMGGAGGMSPLMLFLIGGAVIVGVVMLKD